MRNRLPNVKMEGIPFAGGIREIAARAAQLEREGRDVIHLEVGEPDFDSPRSAKAAAARALENGDVHYTDLRGSEELRLELAAYYDRTRGLGVDPDSEVLVTCGAIESLYITYLSLLNPGDEVIVVAPHFPAYTDQIALAGARAVRVATGIDDGFALTPSALEKAVSPRTRIILINTPNNPSGCVMTRDDLEAVAEVAIKNDLYVISDECYEQFLYGGERAHIATLPGMRERTIIVNSASKVFSMTGWRVGWAVVPSFAYKYFVKAHQNMSTCAAAFAQAGVAEAFRSAWPEVDAMVAEYRRRRDMVMGYIGRMKNIRAITPQGAFYIFPRIEMEMGAPALCKLLLEEAGVATVPGDNFSLPGYFRLAYCRSYEDVERAMRLMSAVLDKL